MPPFDVPTCDSGHQRTEMTFLESHDPIESPSCGPNDDCTEWRERWRYGCPECGQVVEILESEYGTYEKATIRESTESSKRDPTSLSPVE